MQQMFSSESLPTVWQIVPSFEYLIQHWEMMAKHVQHQASGQVTPTLTNESTYSQHEQRVADKPEEFVMYNHHLENHVKYGNKLTIEDGMQGYPHYIQFDHELR